MARSKHRPAGRVLLTPAQTAERLGVSYPTLKRWIYRGSLRTTRTEGGHHRVAQSEIDRFVAVHAGLPGRRRPRVARRGTGVVVAISGRNQLLGVVEEVRVDRLLAQVKLRIGDQHLMAVITRDAVDELKLRRGDEALAIVKATEVMIARTQVADDRRVRL